MNSNRWGYDSLSKGKTISVCDPKFGPLTQGVADINLDLGQDDGGKWEVYARNSKIRARNNAPRPLGPPIPNYNPRPWMNTDMTQKPGTNFRRPHLSTNVTSRPLIGPPLVHGWNWQSQSGLNQSQNFEEKHELAPEKDNDTDDELQDESDVMDDSDDDILGDDEYDSDSSRRSHETRKKGKWCKKFFEILDNLSVEEINDPERQWHCPACQGGAGAIEWYRGLQPLMAHARTKGSKRVKVHREFAELLDEELRGRGASVISSGELFGKWKGLKEEEKHHEIVWPPMVVIQNTRLEQEEDGKWRGMGNQELLCYFSSYNAVKARHAYGPQGHRGMSLLIFEESARGYLEAERLHKHFAEQGTDRDAWFKRPILFLPGGNRQLYGYMAVKEDLDLFNKHSQGKSKVKYDMRSYQEKVVNQIRQMSEDNQQLIYLKNRVAKEQKHAKALEESFGIVTEKLRKTMEENRIVRLRTKMQHEENKEEMNMQELFFKDQIKIIHESRNAKEEHFERMQQEERKKAKQSSSSPLNVDQRRHRVDEYLKFVEVQDKEMEEFVAEKEKLVEAHEQNIAAMKLRHWEEEMKMEKKFDEELAKLMEKYSPSSP